MSVEQLRDQWCHGAGPRALVLLLALLSALLVPSTVAAGASPLDDARARVAAAQQAADEAAARFSEAETREGELDAQVADLEHQIAAGELRREQLRAVVQLRAVRVYKHQGEGTDWFILEGDLLAAARRTKLTDLANAADDRAMAALRDVTEQLAQRRSELTRVRTDLDATVQALRVDQERVDGQLLEAKKALDALEEQYRKEMDAQAARERALAEARRARTIADTGGAYFVSGIVCPIDGPVSFVDSWLAPRSGGVLHQGVDLMSPRGTPDVAVVSGDVEMHTGGNAGNGVWLSGADGNLYYYFHLDSFAGGPRHVAQGEVIGYVGNTGDAAATATHTHFEIHPGHGPAVDPYPSVVRVC